MTELVDPKEMEVGSSEDRRLTMKPARSGRRRSSQRSFHPDELVRVEVRMPASVAAALYQRAHETHTPVSTTASNLLAQALAGPEETPMG